MGWQWHQPDQMQVICTSLQTDHHASTSSLKLVNELMYNTTNIYLPTSPTYCCYTTFGNIGYSSKGVTGQNNVDAQKLMPYIGQDARALFSSILALRFMAVIIVTSY